MAGSHEDILRFFRRVSLNTDILRRATPFQLEGAIAEALRRNQEILRITRTPSADLVLSLRSTLEGARTVLLHVKTASEVLHPDALRTFSEEVAKTRADVGILATTAEMTRELLASASEFPHIRLLGMAELAALAAAHREYEDLFAGSLARLMQDLPLTTMWHQKDPSSQDVDKIDPASLPIPSDYKERIIRVDRLPLKVVKKILEDPRHMHALSPREFEELIAEIVDGLGFTNVVLTPGTGDGGRDVIASKEISGIPITMYFECKKYAEGSKVQVATLRSLLGVVAHESRQANIGVLVTTSSFTRGARDLILSDCRLDGKDYDGIIGWVHELGRDALPGDPT